MPDPLVFLGVEKDARLDFEERKISSLVRSSVHYYNTEEEIERFCQEVARIAKV
jgi:cysteine desulfurase / selenocysteine lyase